MGEIVAPFPSRRVRGSKLLQRTTSGAQALDATAVAATTVDRDVDPVVITPVDTESGARCEGERRATFERDLPDAGAVAEGDRVAVRGENGSKVQADVAARYEPPLLGVVEAPEPKAR